VHANEKLTLYDGNNWNSN